MLELAILGLLKEQDLHGYELKKRLSDLVGFVSVSFGSLYPALGRLERGGAVRAAVGESSAAEVPATGSLTGELALLRAGWSKTGARRGGRSRKVYSITARGHELFAELLGADNQSNEDERTFHLRLAFAGYLPRDARLGLLERRRAHLLQRRSALRSRTSRRERLDAWASSLIEHDQETTEHDLSWIERLIASERSAEADSPLSASQTPGRSGPDSPLSASQTPSRSGPDTPLSASQTPGPGPIPPEAGPAPIAATPAAFSINTPRAAAPTVSVLRPPATEEDLTS